MGSFDRLRDAQLLRGVGRGDEAALRALYQRHASLLAARLLHRGSPPGEVEEVLQDTFLAAWRTAGSFRGDGAVAAWLWGIARNKQREAQRRRARVPVPAAVVDAPADHEDHWVDRLHAEAALAGLGPDLRRALEAVAVRGLSIRDAAAELGIPEGTVKSRLNRARTEIERGMA
jgi:RNA polymerase sigma-70 factor, ECF subfamily